MVSFIKKNILLMKAAPILTRILFSGITLKLSFLVLCIINNYSFYLIM